MRAWRYWNAKRNGKEFDALPVRDGEALYAAMRRFADDEPAGYRHKDYGGGIEMLTDGGQGQGRCLFFSRDDAETLVILLFYKKETRRVPAAILDTARARRAAYLNPNHEADRTDPLRDLSDEG